MWLGYKHDTPIAWVRQVLRSIQAARRSLFLHGLAFHAAGVGLMGGLQGTTLLLSDLAIRRSALAAAGDSGANSKSLLHQMAAESGIPPE